MEHLQTSANFVVIVVCIVHCDHCDTMDHYVISEYPNAIVEFF